MFFFSDGLEKRFGSLSASVSERAEQLQTAVAQSVSVQEGLKGLLSWLDKLALHPGQVEATAQAVQDALTQNQVGHPGGTTAGPPHREPSVSDFLCSSPRNSARSCCPGREAWKQRATLFPKSSRVLMPPWPLASRAL